MSDVKHKPGCTLYRVPHELSGCWVCTCGAKHIAELERLQARVRELEAKLTHLRCLAFSDECEARRNLAEIQKALGEP